MRLKSIVVLLLLACAACAGTGKNMPTVENNVVSLRGYRDVTIANSYQYAKSTDDYATANARDTLTASTMEKYMLVRFDAQTASGVPNIVALTYSSLGHKWYYTPTTGDFRVRLGDHDFAAEMEKTVIDDTPLYLIRVAYFPHSNKCQNILFFLPEENIPDDKKTEEARREYAINQLQEAVVAF